MFRRSNCGHVDMYFDFDTQPIRPNRTSVLFLPVLLTVAQSEPAIARRVALTEEAWGAAASLSPLPHSQLVNWAVAAQAYE